jgi:AraC-like DNA-binding protein
MVLSRKVLELPITQANKFNARMSEKLCQEILHKYIGEEGLTTRIRHIILQVPGEFPDEEAVAAELALSARSLRRKLGELGTSYRDLREQVRSDLAQQYLRNSNMSVDQVAYLLGYTETTNFRRAFKRWLGVSPREYRNRPGG